jgi:hypothetical protein
MILFFSAKLESQPPIPTPIDTIVLFNIPPFTILYQFVVIPI